MPPSIEQKIRAGLPLVRFMQTGLPLPLANKLIQLGMRRVRLGADIQREKVSADGAACEWLIPQNSQPGRVLLYLHGGGFVFGQTPQHLQLGADLARRLSARALMVDYRLAPQHPFPAALEDCFAAYAWLLKQGYEARGIVIAGDSAGGNLTLATLLRARDAGMPLPAAAACLSPVTDLGEKPAPPPGFKDPLLPPKATRLYTTSYLGNADPRNPYISPVYADLTGLPPLLVHVGEEEILRQDAVRIVERAQACGVEAQLHIFPRMWHVWQIFSELPQTEQSLDEIARFFTARLRDAV